MHWERLFEQESGFSARFAPPASPGEVEALIAELGLDVPEAFRARYGLADGSARDGSGGDVQYLLADDGLELLSIAEVRDWKHFWDLMAREFEQRDEAGRAGTFSHAHWHLDWIPLARCDAHTVYALATAPCFGGPAHQVVRFDSKGGVQWEVVSPSLDAFLELLATLVERHATRLSSWELSQLSPGARSIDLLPITPDRFDRPGVPLASVTAPPPRPPTPCLGALARRAAAEHGVDEAALIQRVIDAANLALPGIFGEGRRVEASVDSDSGELQLWCLVVIVDEVKHPGREIDSAAARDAFGEGDVGEELVILVSFRDDPTQQAIAGVQHQQYSSLLAWDDDWARRLDAWRAVYRQLVADALPPV